MFLCQIEKEEELKFSTYLYREIGNDYRKEEMKMRKIHSYLWDINKNMIILLS